MGRVWRRRLEMNNRHLSGKEFQSGYLISRFHRKDNESLRLPLGFLVQAQSERWKRLESHRMDPSRKDLHITLREKASKR